MSDEAQRSYSVEQQMVEPMEGPVEQEVLEDTSHDILTGDLLARNNELEVRVAHLEAENLTHQFLEQQYKDAAYQAQLELAQSQKSLELTKTQLNEVRAEREVLTYELDLEIAERIRIDDAWVEAARLVDQLREELMAKDVRIDSLGRALDTSYMSQRAGVARLHFEIGGSSRSVRRRADGDALLGQEHVHAEVAQPDSQ